MSHLSSSSSQPSLRDLTAIIKTFERPRCVDRLVRSIRKFYPEMRVIVADDSFQPTPRTDVDYLRLPPDVGLSAGRNALLEEVRTPYFLLLDDDYKFTPQTRIERLLAIAAQHKRSIVSGGLMRCKRKLGLFTRRRPQEYHGKLLRSGLRLIVQRGWHRQEEDYYWCDIVLQFLVAGTEDVRAMGGWDARLKINEHEDFFLRAQRANLRVAYCPGVVAEHWNAHPPRSYSQYRNRNFLPFALALHGIRQYIDADGRAMIVPPLSSFETEIRNEHANSSQRRAA